MPLRVSQDGIDREPGDEHSSLEGHRVLGGNEFRVLQETGLCEREVRGSKQKSKRLLEASLGSLGPVLKTVREKWHDLVSSRLLRTDLTGARGNRGASLALEF